MSKLPDRGVNYPYKANYYVLWNILKYMQLIEKTRL